MPSGTHRIERHRDVHCPRRGRIDHVHIIPVAKGLPGFLRPVKQSLRQRQLLILQPRDLTIHRLLANVAQGNDLDAGDHRKAMHCTAPTVAKADNPHSNPRHGRETESLHWGGTGLGNAGSARCAPCGESHRTHACRPPDELSSANIRHSFVYASRRCHPLHSFLPDEPTII